MILSRSSPRSLEDLLSALSTTTTTTNSNLSRSCLSVFKGGGNQSPSFLIPYVFLSRLFPNAALYVPFSLSLQRT